MAPNTSGSSSGPTRPVFQTATPFRALAQWTLLLLCTLLSFLAAPALRAADGALSFTPASSQYVEVPNFHTLGVTNAVTIEFWALTNAVGNHSAFVLETDVGTNRCQMHTAWSDGKTYWDFGNISGGGRLSVATPSGTVGVWTHWAVVASSAGNFMKIYRDGVEVATKTGMSAFNVSTARTLRIGGNTGLFFNGHLDEFRVWNVARSAADIAAHRNLTLSGGEAGLRLCLRFDEASGTTALNSATATGAAYDGTLVNAPVRTDGVNATFTVTTTADAGAGSLRQAIADANAAPGTNTILFHSALSGQTITLAPSSAAIFSDASRTTVDGTTLTSPLTLSGAGATRLLRLASGASVTLKKLILTAGNGADTTIATGHGGAIYSQGALTLEDCVFTNHTVTGDGGAIRATASAPLTVTRCTFTGNSSGTASQLGGAIFSESPVVIALSTFSGNTSHRGGAVRVQHASLTASQSTFTGNTAVIGGALSFGGWGGASSLTHVTITANHATGAGGLSGGGIHCGADAGWTLANSIVSANTAGTGAADIENQDPLTYVGANLVQTVVNTATGTVAGPAPSAAAPLLAALGNYGGPTPTMPPLTGSPAMDAAIGSTITTDQRGVAFTVAPDLGASENIVPTLNDIADLTVSEDSDAAARTLAFTIGNVLASTTFSASSTDPALVAGFTFGGSGANRTVLLNVPANANGSATITITVSNGPATASDSFLLTVTPVDDAPTLNAIDNIVLAPSAGLQTVNLTGIGTGAADETQTLTITAISGNSALIPNPAVSYTSPADNGSLTFTPAAGQNGFALITVTVSDGTSSITRAFYVSVPVNSASQVIHNGDSGVGSLRQAIANALAATGSQSITFDAVLSGQTITLSSEIVLDDSNSADVLTIDATSLPSGLTIDGGPGTNRIFSIPTDDRADLRGLTLTGGNGTGAFFSGTGGAIFNDGTLTLSQCTLSGNSAIGGGGAIYNDGTLTLSQCTLSGNSAIGGGGAILNSGTLTLTQCTLSGNSATSVNSFGGAIYNSSVLTLTQCTLSGNSATSTNSFGGAIYNSGVLTLTQCTLSGNSASGGGGGIRSENGRLTLTNSLIAGNTAPTGPDIRRSTGTIIRSGVNLIGNNGGTTTGNVSTQFPADSPNPNGDYVGTSAAPLNPLLAPLSNNGGPTQTMRLLPGSPALNRSLSISEVQLVEVGGFSSNQFSLTFGTASTPLMANNASAATVQTALNALSTINTGGGSVTVTGGSKIFFVIFNDGPLAGVNQPALTGTGTGTTVTVSTLVDGGNPFTTDQRGFPIVGLADIGAYESGARTLAPIADRAILVNTNTGAIPFPIGTAGTTAAPLTLTATSGNLTLVPDANAVFGGSGADRSVTVTPAAGETGTATLTLTVTDGYDPSSTSFNVTVLPNTGLNTWKLAQFGNNAADPALAGDNADPDGDGLSNALEYAFGSEATSGSAAFFPQSTVSSSQLQLSYLRPVGGVPGVTYGLETHTELVTGGGGWSLATPVTDYDETTSTEGVPPGFVKVILTLTTPVGPGQKRFARVFVSF